MMKKKFNSNSLLRFNRNDFTIHNIKRCFQGFFAVDEYHVSHKKYQGGETDVLIREVFEREDAVVLIPYDPVADTVVLIEQFRIGAVRYGGNPWLLEFIAGMFKEGEHPEGVAIREAKEEANLDISTNSLQKVMTYLSTPGGVSEAIHLFVATVDSSNVSGVYGLEEESEDILTHVVSREHALSLLKEGKITNAATVIGLQWLALNYKELQQAS
ncbi:NUDIX domain-containing protein [Thalassotalea marina]|nr:NUDIX domain-containing protein [Thalassotalea marina]